jgi:hypothetical protein
MPGVGITDAQKILDGVAQQRALVSASVVVQLFSAACYAPALIGLVARPSAGSDRQMCTAAIFLLIGAMGSAADAIFHLLAYAMTAPGLDPSSFVGLMQIMQGQGLRFILPLSAAFLVGSVWLSVVLARRHLVSLWNPALHGLALGVAIAGGLLSSDVGVSDRTVGLAVIALVVGSQIWAGAALVGIRARVLP